MKLHHVEPMASAPAVSQLQRLKPCPFCGGQAHICHDTERRADYVQCTYCEAQTAFFVRGSDAGAIKQWNRRVGDDPLPEAA